MWDIYRAHLPLFEILDPKLTNQWIQSMIIKGQDGGWLPIFPCWNSYTSEMIGDHVIAYIASAYLKGIRDYDVQEAYRLMRQNAFEIPSSEEEYLDGKGRRGLPSYLQYGYIPLEDKVNEAPNPHKEAQVSRTLEYAYDDYALAQMASDLGMQSDYEKLIDRAKNYRNIFDPDMKMVRGRYADRTWSVAFQSDHIGYKYITEGSPRQYTFYVPHDVPGLAALMGARDSLEAALDSIFVGRRYWHGNEPGHQTAFLYNYTASPWKTQEQVRKILTREYHIGPTGLSGNDDAGQMSAWYIFAATGFYPVTPVSGEYLLCSPLFEKIKIQLPDNKTMDIIRHQDSPDAIYIREIKLNGSEHPCNFITYNELINGGTLEFFLTDQPTNWGSTKENQPPGLIPDREKQ
jgi:predicted alpha-1,2-mannosidase